MESPTLAAILRNLGLSVTREKPSTIVLVFAISSFNCSTASSALLALEAIVLSAPTLEDPPAKPVTVVRAAALPGLNVAPAF